MNFFMEERKIMRNDLGLNISDGYLSFDSSDFSRGIHLFTCRVMEELGWKKLCGSYVKYYVFG